MTSLGLTALLQVVMVANGGETYAEAHKTTCETGQPLVVMVGADWCPACRVMKDDVMPQVRQRGLLRKVSFAHVNLDHEQELGAQLTSNGPIPQLLMYRRTSDGWRLRRLIGGQSIQTIESFLNEGIEADLTAKKADKPAQGSGVARGTQGDGAPTGKGHG